MTKAMNLEHGDSGALIRICIKPKKRGDRKEVAVVDELEQRASKSDTNVPSAVAIARAHAWQELLETGKYRSVREMAKDLGVCHTYMARLLRFTVLAPDIIDAILDGREPDGFSQTRVTGAIPAEGQGQMER